MGSGRMRQVVDWSAAAWAGGVAGSLFLLGILFVVPRLVGGNAWVMIRLLASPVLGEGVLAPPATFHGGALLAGLALHFALSLLFSLALAIVIHRWGLATGILGGALFGLVLYGINFYTMTAFYPWFFALRSWPLIATHVVFGATAGGVYEALEVERFVPAEESIMTPLRTRRPGGKIRLLFGLALAVFALISYFGSSAYNPVTGENQHLGITAHQEIALGLQAAPEMIRMHGGPHPDERARAFVEELGRRIVARSAASQTGWEFEFHLLQDPETVNAFALPGGPVFLTDALFRRLETEGQVAAVLGHEIGHVVARHSAQRIAKSRLTDGLTGAVLVASDAGYEAARAAQMIGALVTMRYGREDELQSDRLGVRFLAEAGYDPRSMIRVMEILDEASAGARPPEFFSTHPNPENRIEEIRQAITEQFPSGVPEGLVS